MNIRPYTAKDKEVLAKLLALNVPEFFHESEKADYLNYLEHELEDYFVVEENDEIIGAGGINYFPEKRTARIAWDIVKPEAQGKGIGRQLTEYRLHHLSKNQSVDRILVRTSQLAYRFYEKFGFTVARVEKDFWAEGFHLYEMEQKNESL
jgi:ribosomal-protein-alanine N-acetyltransferase